MKHKTTIVLSLLFAVVFSFSFGFHAALTAGEWTPDPCSVRNDLGNCCWVAAYEQVGVCIEFSTDVFQCRCDCFHVDWPTCDGPEHCYYEVCGSGGGG